LLEGLKAWQETVQAAIRATQFGEDRQNAFYHLAALYASMNDRLNTERSLNGAIEAAPNWYKPHWMLAQVLLSGGEVERAREQARIAGRLDGGKHAEVQETLHKLR